MRRTILLAASTINHLLRCILANTSTRITNSGRSPGCFVTSGRMKIRTALVASFAVGLIPYRGVDEWNVVYNTLLSVRLFAAGSPN